MDDATINIIKFSEVISALQDIEHPFPPRLLKEFSDLSRKELVELLSIWPELPLNRRQALIEDLDDLNEHDTLTNLNDLALALISDLEPIIRVLAVRLLWECEDANIVPIITDLMQDDLDEGVRATAAGLLGRFVYLGELDAIPDRIKLPMENNLLEVVAGEDLDQVRRKALESLGYSSNPKIISLIHTAYETKDVQWVSSAICAMGRSVDDRWTEIILKELNSLDSEVLFEAVRAAGELELKSAVEQLLAHLDDETTDPETRLAAIWSLSQIGGEEAKEKLQELLVDPRNDEELDWVEQAIDNLELSGGAEPLELIDLDLDEDLDSDDYEDEENNVSEDDIDEEDEEDN